jgi:hypothetical protein
MAQLPEHPILSFAEFLQSSPPNQHVQVTDLFTKNDRFMELNQPVITLMCESKHCNGPRFFAYRSKTGNLNFRERPNDLFVDFLCKNCNRTLKSFALLAMIPESSSSSGIVVKVGEWPPFSPPKTPTRLLRMLDSDKDLFLKGRRAELHGLGIGAFTYYRRVVENRKDQLFDEIIKVVQKVELSPAQIVADLSKAKENFRFRESIEGIRIAIPQSLLMNGQNPLILLHSVLSAGIHNRTDEQCLEIAKHVRVVLATLAERIGEVLAEQQELDEAVAALLKVNSEGA